MQKILLVIIIFITVSGCSSKNIRQTNNYPEYIQKVKTIAVMPPNLYIHQITAGKQVELMDEWTDQAKEMVTEGLKESFQNQHGYDIKFIDKDWIKENHRVLWKEYSSLYSTVAKSLMLHAMDYGPHKFSTKKDSFDYTLGSEVSILAKFVQADMLFFIYGEEYYSTKGKIVSELFSFAASAVLSGGTVAAFPTIVPDSIYFSVVNGQTGQIEWFKKFSGGIFTRGFNNKENISKIIESIMKDMFP